jgi:hypothetical protein
MKSKPTSCHLKMRAFAVSVAVCLLVLQGFAFSLACHGAPSRHSGTAVLATALRAPECHHAGDPTAPEHSSHDCCVYCSVADRDALAQAIAFVADFVIAPTPSVVAAVYYQVDIRNPVPLGLTTSWSSRAPPRIG